MKFAFFILLLFPALGYSVPIEYKLKPEWAREVTPSSDLNLGIFSLGFTNSTCTGTLISQEGHLLVARHCLEPAISVSNQVFGEAGEVPMSFSNTRIVSNDMVIYDFIVPNITQNLQVPVGLDNSVVYAKISAIGKGYLYPRFTSQLESEQLVTIHKELSNDGYSVGGDFAIVQIQELKNQACYRLSKQKIKIDEKVSSISFPCYKEYGDWPQSRTAKIRKISNSSDGKMSEDSLGDFFLPRGSFLTDNIVEACNSGSSIMNGNSEIIGVLHSGFNISKDEMRVVSISTERILELLPEDFRQHILELNSLCDKKL